MFKAVEHDPKEFVHRFITIDDTWIHYYTPETTGQSKQCVSICESAPKKANTVPSAGKVMVIVFYDAHGVIFTDYLEKGKR